MYIYIYAGIHTYIQIKIKTMLRYVPTAEYFINNFNEWYQLSKIIV